ncbi:TPA: DUF6262 family protein, partial [Staphylococcus aureus]
AAEAKVSKSWLYKESDIRKQIENIRHRQLNGKRLNSTPIKKNKKSEEILIKTLKARIKELEEENGQLKNQVQKLYGELYFKD